MFHPLGLLGIYPPLPEVWGFIISKGPPLDTHRTQIGWVCIHLLKFILTMYIYDWVLFQLCGIILNCFLFLFVLPSAIIVAQTTLGGFQLGFAAEPPLWIDSFLSCVVCPPWVHSSHLSSNFPIFFLNWLQDPWTPMQCIWSVVKHKTKQFWKDLVDVMKIICCMYPHICVFLNCRCIIILLYPPTTEEETYYHRLETHWLISVATLFQ